MFESPVGRAAALGVALVLLLASGCANPLRREPLRVQPPPSGEGALQVDVARFEKAMRQYRDYDGRLRPVVMRLLSSSPELCGNAELGRSTGTGLLSRGEVEKWASLPERRAAMLAAAESVLGVREGVTVVTVVPGSSAAQVGIRPGDRIVHVNGEEIDSIRRLNALVEETGMGPLTAQLERPGASMEVNVPAEAACRVPVFLVVNQTPALFPHGRGVTLSSGTMDFAASDDELAFALSTSFAHYMLGFRPRDRLRKQRQSDYLGVYLAVRAGYDPAIAVSLLVRWADSAPMAIQSEPGPLEGAPGRLELIRKTLEEIEAKRAAGEPILPTLVP